MPRKKVSNPRVSPMRVSEEKLPPDGERDESTFSAKDQFAAFIGIDRSD